MKNGATHRSRGGCGRNFVDVCLLVDGGRQQAFATCRRHEPLGNAQSETRPYSGDIARRLTCCGGGTTRNEL